MKAKDFEKKSPLLIFLSYFKNHRKLFAVDILCACGIAGIIAGTITMTGLANMLINGIVALANGRVIIALFLTMLCCIVLGMGVPTTANYCIMAATCAPILVQMGVPIIAAHFFVFYFGIVADLTPPVALAAYAGAAIAQANPMKTAFTATKLAIGAFIVPFVFALNPAMLPENIDGRLVFRLYVSPLLPLNLDNHNRIPTSYLRLLRRIVRDYETRNSSVQRTLSMWDSVRAGERRWIFPFQEHADVIFNSSTLYELAVLKKHIFPLLTAVQPEDECYDEVRSIVKILNYVVEADVDDEIPPTSLVREFIGGNSFYR